MVGHLLFSPVEMDNGRSSILMVGLALVGVLPEYQGQGADSRLIRAGLETCRERLQCRGFARGAGLLLSRFGFELASGHGLGNEYGVDHEFMVAELRSEVLDGVEGTVRYRPEFGQVEP